MAEHKSGPRSSRQGARTGQRLTIRAIKAKQHTGASYGESGRGARQEILWDTAVPGLGLRLYPSGRRSWCLRYRVKGRRRIVTLGAYGVLTLDMARKEARGLLVDLQRTGEDPLAKPRETPTVSDLIPVYLGAYSSKQRSIRRA